MKNFRELATSQVEVNELKIDKKSYNKFADDAIKNINLMIEFGRKTAELDNKQLNSLLDGIKNIHAGQDAIRIALEPKEDEEKNKADKTAKKGEKQW